ncbi:hypothetical protein BN975_03689 [Mycolicibacterium farcinogenes]|nr:hypothetical protein BN975_03689 [Mycolicibacterium farcinogenes]
MQRDHAGPVGQRGPSRVRQRLGAGHPDRTEQLATGAGGHDHPPGQAAVVLAFDEHRLVGLGEVPEHPAGFEQGAKSFRRAAAQDRLDASRVSVLLQTRVRQDCAAPVLDGDRAAHRVGEAVGQREQIGWAAPGFGFPALQHHAVDDGRQFTPGDLRVDRHHCDAAVVRRLVIRSAHQHHHGTRRRGPAHRLGHRLGPDCQQDVTDHLPRLVHDDAAQLGRARRRPGSPGRGAQSHAVAAQNVDQAV